MAQGMTMHLTQNQQASAIVQTQLTDSAKLASLTAAEEALLEGCCIVQAAACTELASTPRQQQRNPVRGFSKNQCKLLSTAVSQLRGLLAASKRGRLTSVAASSFGSVLNSAFAAQLHKSQSQLSGGEVQDQSQHAQQASAAGLTDSVLRDGVSELVAAVDQVAKLPSAAIGKQGVAMGLGALLGGVTWLNSKAAINGLVSRPGWSKETKNVLQV